MKAGDFLRSQFRRGSWIKADAEVLACTPGDYMWGSDFQYLGVSHYCIQVRYSANGQEVLAEFRSGTPWAEGDALPLRYDPANPECNNRTGTWLLRNSLLLILIGLLILTGIFR
jgi:hypothetical protein